MAAIEASSQRRRVTGAAADAVEEVDATAPDDTDVSRPTVQTTAEALVTVAQADGRAFLWHLVKIVAITVILTIQATAILVTVPQEVMDDRTVDPETCGGCDCWDGLSKAPYDKGRFKYVYYNITWTTVLIVAVLLLYVVLLERAIESVARSVWRGTARLPALLAFAAALPGNLYGAGAVYHYLNDRFHAMLPTQLYFCVTELMTAVAVWRCIDAPASVGGRRTKVARLDEEVYAWVALVNSACHVVLAGLDQIFLDLFVRQDVAPQVYARALIFSSTDVVVLAWAVYKLGGCTCAGDTAAGQSGFKRKLAVAGAVTVAICLWYRLALPLV